MYLQPQHYNISKSLNTAIDYPGEDQLITVPGGQEF